MSTDKIADERAFIHDLSSPLMVAMGMVEFTENKLSDDQEELKIKLAKAQKALAKISVLLKDRRGVLITELDTLDN